MRGIETIMREAEEAGVRAAERGVEPTVIQDQQEIDNYPPFPFPMLGDHVPEGWELVDTIMADSSGWGSPGEPALTPEQLRRRLKVGMGYGLMECGQFQVIIGEFQRENQDEEQ